MLHKHPERFVTLVFYEGQLLVGPRFRFLIRLGY